jgi:putative ABC transport system ATP-binding protein|tara:strand:+ start:458 stop:1090 length:633 start_codon:yes stop_codon:yes gene_type:complete
MLKIKKISKKYHDTEEIIYKDLEIKEGEFISILGPSGSGKSTFIDLISFLKEATTGEIEIFGNTFSKLKDKSLINSLRKDLGVMSSNSQLISSLNIKENIKLPLLIHKVNDSQEYFDMLIDRLNLKKILYKYPSSLSSGEKQRSLLARAVILKPKLLIADEPTANLDSNNTHQLVNYLIYLNDVLKTTIIVATHDDIVSNASKRIYELKK